MFQGIRRFFSEISQDVDGGFSAKRAVFLVIAVALLLMVLGVYFKAVDDRTLNFMDGAMQKFLDFEKWLGGFILAERAPQSLASFRGTKTAAVTPEEAPHG